jgi:hypothetical protein
MKVSDLPFFVLPSRTETHTFRPESSRLVSTSQALILRFCQDNGNTRLALLAPWSWEMKSTCLDGSCTGWVRTLALSVLSIPSL